MTKQSSDTIRISVRNLVEFIFRSGDIDNRRSGAKEKQAMEAGSRLHRKIQKQMGSSYESEVTLRHTVKRAQFGILIEGRADGIFSEKTKIFMEKAAAFENKKKKAPDEKSEAFSAEIEEIQESFSITETEEAQQKFPKKIFVVDEIKGIYRDPRKLKEAVLVHKAQALCYAYIYALQNGQQLMGVQMTYSHLETEEIRRFYEVYTFEELEKWFEALICEYERWAQLEIRQHREMCESLQGMEFPFPYRPGQRKLAVSVYRSIEQKGELFIQAPTGIGKTMSVLFPALKAMGEEFAERVFYLTAKTITRTVAQEAFDILRRQGLKIHSVTITARDKICPQEVCSCNPEGCPYAKGHFDRVNEAVFDMISHEECMERENILEYAKKHHVCPFELNLDLTLWSQGIICDYNYVFDPNVYLRRFFGDSVQGKYLFLVDEAHNLPDRAREMYSAALVKEDVLKTEKLMKETTDLFIMDSAEAVRAAGRSIRALRALNKKLLSLKKETEKVMLLEEIEDLYDLTLRAQEAISSFLEETTNNAAQELLDFFFALRHFNAICEILDSSYVPYCSVEKGLFQVKLLCANPAVNVHNCIGRAVSTVFFSATMLPMHYYRELLTTEKNAFAIYVDSPFDKNRRLLAVAEDVTSRYTMRNPIQYHRILDYITQVTAARTGNYMVFFPSYQYMMEVTAVYEEMYGKDEARRPFLLLLQEQGMNEAGRDAFLEKFSQETTDAQGKELSLVGFCVIGGIFSEGIDLTGERLIGVLVVGTGLAQISTEGELLRGYFEKNGRPGYDYAYRFPGINKVFQAAGRVIRTAEDEGVVILLDNRMLLENHVKLFPMDWDNYQAVRQNTIGKLTEAFWNRES
ncbi:MAG: ATP-dependent DNA helicase [Lachnospiraceae bacterium]|nr:ATP-dependent DNA helicase [Lachnospiraceae bacterium]